VTNRWLQMRELATQQLGLALELVNDLGPAGELHGRRG